MNYSALQQGFEFNVFVFSTKGTRKIQPQILMVTGGKVYHYVNIETDIITICSSFLTLFFFLLWGSQAHFITKRTWWPLLEEQGKQQDLITVKATKFVAILCQCVCYPSHIFVPENPFKFHINTRS